jgi:hypothetical protein
VGATIIEEIEEEEIPIKKSIQMEKKGVLFKIIFGTNVQKDTLFSIGYS